MHPVFWLLAGMAALILANGFVQAYRLLHGTLADTVFLTLLAGAAIAAAYVFS